MVRVFRVSSFLKGRANAGHSKRQTAMCTFWEGLSGAKSGSIKGCVRVCVVGLWVNGEGSRVKR